MKKFILVLLLLPVLILGVARCSSAAQGQYPAAPDGYIYDGAQLLSKTDQEKITRILRELESKTTAQVAVASVPSTEPEPIEMYAVNLFSLWGIGQKKKDNGVLFLVAKLDRTLRIEVGYGLEGVLTDVICKRIIDNIVVPKFRDADYSAGVAEGVSAIVSLIAKEYNVAITGEESTVMDRLGPTDDSDSVWIMLFLLIVIVIFLLLSNGSSGGPRGGGYWTGDYGGGYRGGGFSGGGFGGFGGGFSGGGGASGRW